MLFINRASFRRTRRANLNDISETEEEVETELSAVSLTGKHVSLRNVAKNHSVPLSRSVAQVRRYYSDIDVPMQVSQVIKPSTNYLLCQ